MRRMIIIILVLGYLSFPKDISASIVTITPSGETVLNVLSEQDIHLEIPKSESIKVNEVAGKDGKETSTSALANDEGKIKLTLDDSNSTQTLDVTDIKESIVEIEERPEVERIAIKIKEDKFVISLDKLKVTTEYEPLMTDQYAC